MSTSALAAPPRPPEAPPTTPPGPREDTSAAWAEASRDRPLVPPADAGVAREYGSKRWLDLAVGALAALAALPLLPLVALAVKLTSRGPVLFTQLRVGRDGRLFKLYKFRTMQAGAQERRADLEPANEAGGVIFKMRSDPRVTPLGYWLRRTSLDELPQLINVLRGEMSLVGPRPAIPEEVLAYGDDDRRRLAVRPGLTCYWQVLGRSELPFPEQMRLDARYVRDCSLATDLGLLLRTVPAVLTMRGAF